MRRVNGRSLTQFVTQKSKYTYLYLLGCGSLKKKNGNETFYQSKGSQIRIRKKCDRRKQIIAFFCLFLVRCEKLKFDGQIFENDSQSLKIQTIKMQNRLK